MRTGTRNAAILKDDGGYKGSERVAAYACTGVGDVASIHLSASKSYNIYKVPLSRNRPTEPFTVLVYQSIRQTQPHKSKAPAIRRSQNSAAAQSHLNPSQPHSPILAKFFILQMERLPPSRTLDNHRSIRHHWQYRCPCADQSDTLQSPQLDTIQAKCHGRPSQAPGSLVGG